MNSLNSSDSSDSGQSEDDDVDPKPPSYKSVAIPTPLLQPLKRSHSMHTSNTPPSSPTMKKAHLSTSSSIWKALETKEGPQGILLFFRKATEEEHCEWVQRTCAVDAKILENMEWNKKRQEQISQVTKRRNSTKCKQKQRAKEKKHEVLEGLRSPGGTRIKVNHLIFDRKKI